MLQPTHVYSEQEEAHFREVWAQLVLKITRELTEEQTTVLRALVYRFHHVWCLDGECPPVVLLPPGTEPVVQLRKGASPQAEPRRRQSYRKRMAVEEIIRKYLDRGYGPRVRLGPL